ncbi:MAG: beta-lactamase family protein [Bifidobacteriaceae bacterium]|jgi:CubicO group peptidase (beta-lactamase class C family)|nr:beta-lactamase family protein [Bifidobacteriaceae bacterium]
MGWERVKAFADARGGAYSILALRGGRVVAEFRRGCGPDSLFYCFSVTKPVTAMAVHLLAERGRLDLDRPIARHWPEFGRNGKAAITARQVLTHRAGVPAALGHPGLDIAAMGDWDLSVRAAARARPRYRPGRVVAYHVLTFGFILGELVRRVSGELIDRFAGREFFAPLGMDAHLRLPAGEVRRVVPVRGKGGNLASPVFLNRPAMRRALVPAASLHTTARSLASFYQMLLADGLTASGRRLLRPATVASALAVSSDGAVDRTLRQRQRYGQGFQLGGLPGVVRGIGTASPPSAFGHNGSAVCNAWAEPERQLVFIYLSNTTQLIRPGLAFASALSDLAWAAFDAA